eukprot:gene41446-20137_t
MPTASTAAPSLSSTTQAPHAARTDSDHSCTNGIHKGSEHCPTGGADKGASQDRSANRITRCDADILTDNGTSCIHSRAGSIHKHAIGIHCCAHDVYGGSHRFPTAGADEGAP